MASGSLAGGVAAGAVFCDAAQLLAGPHCFQPLCLAGISGAAGAFFYSARNDIGAFCGLQLCRMGGLFAVLLLGP